MLRNLRWYVLCAAALLLYPMTAALRGQKESPAPDVQNSAYYRVLDAASGSVETVPLRDYLIGAVAAEMPASFAPEALKAQAVACHTYAARIAAQNAKHPDDALKGADFSNDPAQYQAYYSAGALKAAFGADYESKYAKIAAAVDAVSDELLCCAGEPIVAAFHAISSGRTESAGEIWGQNLPYLVNVDSPGDFAAPSYETECRIAPDALKRALAAVQADIQYPENPSEWLKVTKTAQGGTVLQMQAGSAELSGQAVRDALGLRSAVFSVQYAGDTFIFTVHGHGHGVGMSQYGAQAMAEAGSDYRAILAHYYPGTELVNAE